jgi:5-methylcytosine-specific restriction endonuclease McrA
MRLTKAQRATLREKFGGCCAYCGQPLGDRWHADHFEAVYRGLGSHWTGNELGKPENDTIENLMPACAPCNISKATFTLEQWRGWLARHVAALNANHSTYRLVKAYGLVVETGNPVTFHFERWVTTLSGVSHGN